MALASAGPFHDKPGGSVIGMQLLFIGINPNLHTQLYEPFKLTHFQLSVKCHVI